jgi:hypothetical protein
MKLPCKIGNRCRRWSGSGSREAGWFRGSVRRSARRGPSVLCHRGEGGGKTEKNRFATIHRPYPFDFAPLLLG